MNECRQLTALALFITTVLKYICCVDTGVCGLTGRVDGPTAAKEMQRTTHENPTNKIQRNRIFFAIYVAYTTLSTLPRVKGPPSIRTAERIG